MIEGGTGKTPWLVECASTLKAVAELEAVISHHKVVLPCPIGPDLHSQLMVVPQLVYLNVPA